MNKDRTLLNYNFDCCFVRLRPLVCHTEGRTRLQVFQSRVLRKIFGLTWDEVRGEWRKLHNEELRDLYVSSNIIRVMKYGRMRHSGHVACMGER
jgi:hypothetical protein